MNSFKLFITYISHLYVANFQKYSYLSLFLILRYIIFVYYLMFNVYCKNVLFLLKAAFANHMR